MKPNLKFFYIDKIDISATITVKDELINQIREMSPPDEDGDSAFYDSYKVERNSYIGWLVLSAPAKDNKTCGFTLHYESGKGGRLRTALPRISQAIEILSKLDSPLELASIFNFKFGRRDKVKTVVNLPLTLSESPNLPFDKIQGIHFLRLEGKRYEYHVILDCAKDGSLFETVIFQHKTIINKSLIDELIKEANDISNGFIFKEQQN